MSPSAPRSPRIARAGLAALAWAASLTTGFRAPHAHEPTAGPSRGGGSLRALIRGATTGATAPPVFGCNIARDGAVAGPIGGRSP